MRGKEGVTLIELMIVVVCVALLAAIAIPAYDNYVTKSRRSNAYTALATIQAAEEMCRAENGTYAGFGTTLPGCSATMAGPNYTITLTNIAATTFTATATPQQQQAGDFTFSVTQNGTDTYTYNGNSKTVTDWTNVPNHP
jgi:type IV pilus assembly protein PilE